MIYLRIDNNNKSGFKILPEKKNQSFIVVMISLNKTEITLSEESMPWFFSWFETGVLKYVTVKSKQAIN